jgi:hypothetical protein
MPKTHSPRSPRRRQTGPAQPPAGKPTGKPRKGWLTPWFPFLRAFVAADDQARNYASCPPLSEELILAWADAHFERTGRWPTYRSGPIPDVLGESWLAVEGTLYHGLRGLSGRTTLARFLEEKRGKRHILPLPPLSVEQILAWADAHHRRTGQWPTRRSGAVVDADEKITWKEVNWCLHRGFRSLPAGSSLPQLLAQRRGVRHRRKPPPLCVEQILAWARAHHERTGRWVFPR